MNSAGESREGWQPQTAQERGQVLRELEEIVASPHFCNSKRYPALLRYIVENTLAGRAELLKERTLGIEVFDRPRTYDTSADTVVRYTAGEVRRRLLLYYSERDHNAGVRISLPAGSYVPEFIPDPGEHKPAAQASEIIDSHTPAAMVEADETTAAFHYDQHLPGAAHSLPVPPVPQVAAEIPLGSEPAKSRRVLWMLAALLVVALMAAAVGWRRWSSPQASALDDFWGPVLRGQHAVTVCTGGVIFSQRAFSGVITAGEDAEYPFVSMQIASAIAQVSALAEHFGTATQLLPAPTTALSDLRERPVILLGGYNNKWALVLLQSQRYQLGPGPGESIIDRTQPQVHWMRDPTLPYGSADDFALVARFKDSTTGNWVVALSGLGRNGTEAAAIFATSPEYLQQLEKQLGRRLSDQNLEVVLKVRVIDGKTGAPSVLAARTW